MAGLSRAGKVHPQRRSFWTRLITLIKWCSVGESLAKHVFSLAPLRLENFLLCICHPIKNLVTEIAKLCTVCFVHTTWTWWMFVSLFISMNICQWSIETAHFNKDDWVRRAMKAQYSPTQRHVWRPRHMAMVSAWLGYEVPLKILRVLG